MKRFLGCLLAALLALSLCACAESAQAGKATVTVDQSALYARVGEEVTLPAATAADGDGKDCSASVSVTVTFGGSTVFSGKGNAENTFTPTQEGAYTANYFVAEGESVLSDTYTVNIQVNDNTPVEPARSAPVIRVDTSYASFYEDEGGSTRAAEGYDEVDKDLTDSVRVSVTDYEGEAVFSGVGEAPSLPQYVSARTADGRLCLFPARFEIEPSDYAAVGSHTVGGYVLYGENYGLSFEAEMTVKDGAKVDGSLGDAVWQDATVHEIALTADGTGQPPYYPAEAAFMVYAGEDGLYFAFDVKDAKLATNYNLTTAADWNLWQNDGIEVYIDASGGASASLTEDSLTVRCTASDLLRVYAPNAAYSGWSVTNLYNSQAERVQGIRRELCIDGTPNQAYDADEGYTFELFVPYSVFGTDEISDYRIAAGVRSRANIPGGTETAFGAWSAAEQAAFTGVSPAQWVALADAL